MTFAVECRGRVLLVRRDAEPGRGRWDIPGGFMQEGETAEQAVRREVREETGLELEQVRLAMTDINHTAEGTVLDLLFEVEGFRGEPAAGSDAAALAWFPLGQLPADLAFDSTRRLLGRFAESRRSGPLRLLGGETVEPETRQRIAGFDAVADAIPSDLEIECGEWRIHDGALCGSISGERPAVAWFRPAVSATSRNRSGWRRSTSRECMVSKATRAE